MDIFYKVCIEWCKYPFQNEVEDKYVEFFYRYKKKFIKLHHLRMDSNTSIDDKLKYLKENYSEKVKQVKKLNNFY